MGAPAAPPPPNGQRDCWYPSKVPRKQCNLQTNGALSSSHERSVLYLGTRTLISEDPKVLGKKSTDFPSELLEMKVGRATPVSTGWFLDPCILPVGAAASYIEFFDSRYILHCVGTILKKNRI